jgi:hypothetical protein
MAIHTDPTAVNVYSPFLSDIFLDGFEKSGGWQAKQSGRAASNPAQGRLEQYDGSKEGVPLWVQEPPEGPLRPSFLVKGKRPRIFFRKIVENG